MGAGRLIRRATAADIPRIIDMIERLAAAVDGAQRVCRLRTGETVARLIASPSGFVMVSDGGFIAGEITSTIINPDPVALEWGWYADDRSGLRLMRSFEAWAQQRGATLVKMSCNGGAAQRILERAGYRLVEMTMVK